MHQLIWLTSPTFKKLFRVGGANKEHSQNFDLKHSSLSTWVSWWDNSSMLNFHSQKESRAKLLAACVSPTPSRRAQFNAQRESFIKRLLLQPNSQVVKRGGRNLICANYLGLDCGRESSDENRCLQIELHLAVQSNYRGAPAIGN
jgi:hypothetical protein